MTTQNNTINTDDLTAGSTNLFYTPLPKTFQLR